MMVATDIAARGIDISDLSHIFNYDLPEFDEVYVHRCGRTGRIGKTGVAVSLVRGKYLTHLSSLKRQYNVPFEEVELPDEKEILWMQAERLALQLIEAADGVEVEQYRPVAESMMERGDVKEILAYLLRQYFSDRRPPSASSGEERRPREAREPRGRRPRFERPEGEAPAAEGAEARPEGEDATLSPARDERPRREPRPPRQPETDAVTLYVTLGRDDGVADLSALIQKLSQLSGVDAGHFTGRGDVRDHSSHIEVDPESADQIAAGVHGKPRGDGPSINMRPNTETTEAPAPSDALPSTQVAITAEGAGAEGGGTAEGAKVEGPRTIVCERARPKARGPRRGPRR
jgi:ATP-dependent RNA helicase DeaD